MPDPTTELPKIISVDDHVVEPAQRLLRPLDDLLDGEVGGVLLVHERERGVEEALHPLLGP